MCTRFFILNLPCEHRTRLPEPNIASPDITPSLPSPARRPRRAATHTSRRYPRRRKRAKASPETVPMAWGVPPRPPSSKVQALYELCKRTFPSPSAAGAGASPSPPLAEAVRSISSLMGNALLPAANFDPFPFLPLRCGLWACCDSLMARPRLAQFFILFHYATAIKKWIIIVTCFVL